MQRKYKRAIRKKLLILPLLIIFLFSLFKIGISFASIDKLVITGAEISFESDTVEINNFKYEKNKIINDVTFHKVGDSITYKIKIKNNDEKNYEIKSINDDNENSYISYIYDIPEGTTLNSQEEMTLQITEEYTHEVEDLLNRKQDFSVNIAFTLIDENKNETTEDISIDTSSNSYLNPKTSDDINIFTGTAIISLVMLILLSKKKSVRSKHIASRNNKHNGKRIKLLSLIIFGILVTPIISKAANDNFVFEFINNVSLKDKLIFTYIIDDNEYEEIINYGEKVTELENPEKDGYIFKGWEKEDGSLFDLTSLIKDDEKVIAKFEPIQYTIEYELNGENVVNTNPSTYTIESDEIILNNPSRNGYDFVGWTGTDLDGKVENVSISKGSKGNRTYTANWVQTEYSIEYHLNKGTVTGNPITYTIESNTITLNNPSKDGYDFVGWTGTDLNEKTINVTIENGSTGAKEYTANWETINYTITYEGLTDDEKSALNNPTTYNIETENVILNNPQDRKDNDEDLTERFLGWKENESTSINVTIETGTFGNKSYEAIWQTVDPNTYTITYDLDNGTLTNENLMSFTKFTNTFTLNNPSKNGYTFAGWTGSNGTTPETTVQVTKGTRNDLSYKANWTEDTYTITYNLNGGTVENENPVSYTVNSDDITLNNPSKTGYTFVGWTGTDLTEKTTEVTIQNKSIGNRTYTANWTANNYQILFDKNTGTGSMANQQMTYDVRSKLNSNVFTKVGNTFVKWNTQADGTGTDYTNKQSVTNLATDGEITLYAQWELNNNTVAAINETTYSSLQAAIDAVPTNNTQTTVTLLTNTSENVTVNKNQNIIFDFQNFTITNNLTENIKNAIITNNGTIEISNGTLETTSVEAAAINNNSTGNLNITGGQIKVIAENGRQSVYNNKGTVTISDAAYLTSISKIRATVQNVSGGKMTITGGTIIENGPGNQAGVNNAGTLTIGTKDGNISRTSPLIQGTNYGVSSSSNLNFYDGIIKGKVNGFNDEGKVTDAEPETGIITLNETIDNVAFKASFLGIKRTVTFIPNYDAYTETVQSVEYNTAVGTLPELSRAGFSFDGWFTSLEGGDQITKNTIITNNITVYAHWTEIFVAQIGETKYKTLKAAIDAVPTDNTQTNIKLIHDTKENVSIISTKNIVLNLGNCTLSNNSISATISNYGTLSISNGKITSNSDETAAINNFSSGNLKISNIQIITTGLRQAVYNSGGRLEILEGSYLSSNPDGRLDNYTLDRGTVQNIDNGTAIITGGTIINTTQQAISNEATLIIGVKDNNINTSSPIIIGKDHGVKNIKTFKFYDGIIKGYTDAILGDITEIEDNSTTKASTEVIDGLTYKTINLITNE